LFEEKTDEEKEDWPTPHEPYNPENKP